MTEPLFLGDTVAVDRDGRAARITVDRPPLNILDLATLTDLVRAVAALEDDPPAVLIVRGGGDRAFSAGVAVEDHTAEKIERMLGLFHGALERLRRLPAISIAVVRGHCLGGGMELALACDLVVADDDARFGQPEIELGCFPPYAAALYPGIVGAGRTLELLATGRLFDAAEAERLGLVTRVVAPAELDEAAAALRDALLAKSGAVLPMIKRAVSVAAADGMAAGLAEAERIYLEELARTADMTEGLEAFLAKRRPEWKHR